jgi:hypothetical protein
MAAANAAAKRLGGGEPRIERQSLVEFLDGLGRAEVLEERLAALKVRQRLRRLRRDRDLDRGPCLGDGLGNRRRRAGRHQYRESQKRNCFHGLSLNGTVGT